MLVDVDDNFFNFLSNRHRNFQTKHAKSRKIRSLNTIHEKQVTRSPTYLPSVAVVTTYIVKLTAIFRFLF